MTDMKKELAENIGRDVTVAMNFPPFPMQQQAGKLELKFAEQKGELKGVWDDGIKIHQGDAEMFLPWESIAFVARFSDIHQPSKKIITN